MEEEPPMDPTLAGAEIPHNRGRSRPESNPIETPVVTEDGIKYVKARFVFISPKIESFCVAGAYAYLQTFWKHADEIPPRELMREKALLMIAYGLRKDDDPTRSTQVFPWPANTLDITTGQWNKTALHNAPVREQCPNIDDLWQEYILFKESEFPPSFTPSQWRALVAAGKELSVETFLLKHGFLQTLRALPGLEAAYQK